MNRPRAERRAVDGILLLDKPLGLSSNAALQRVKRAFRADKAGHTGSLDPLATGLLPICLGQATKLSGLLLDGDKRYLATMKLGARTATGDAEGVVVERSDVSGIDRKSIESARQRLLGPIQQIPPMYSALKRDGETLYALARQGLEVERAPRSVTIHALRTLALRMDEIDFEVLCSKGTYVRTLAEDWAAGFGQCAHLVRLRRVAAAPFDAPAMIRFDVIESADDVAALDRHMLPIAAALPEWPRQSVDADAVRRLRNGQAVALQAADVVGDCAVFDPDDRLLCLAHVKAGGLLHPRRWLARD